jgi:hypothetical protein
LTATSSSGFATLDYMIRGASLMMGDLSQGVLTGHASPICSQLSVKYVVDRSPAEESGFFSQGDILTSVDGQVPQNLH